MKVLILSGSARADSVNTKLARLAAAHAQALDVEVDLVATDDLRLPLFDLDQEASGGLPTAAKQLKQRFLDAKAIIFASPEYNSSITPLLKNAIDWVSCSEHDDEPALAAYHGKVAGLLAASPGALGGLRGLVHVRSILGNIGVLVVPPQLAVPRAYEAFDGNGQLREARHSKSLKHVVEEVVKVARALA